jgi:transposase
LEALATSRTEPAQAVERARMLLAYADGHTVSTIARDRHVSRPTVERCVDKALQFGVGLALGDLPGRGRRPRMTPADRAWVVDLACRRPKELGYPEELWTTRRLARHIRQHAEPEGHAALTRIGRGTVSKLLREGGVQPHKIRYYLERRDPDFETKMAEVLCVYKQVQLRRAGGTGEAGLVAFLSYDEKPGIQALATTGPDRPPVPGAHPTIMRDHEYVRHGTMTLMAGLDLVTGHIHHLMVDRHRSREFVQFLEQVDAFYPPAATIRMILDNHSAHISHETRRYLATRPNRFEFTFTPKHGSWLNLVEALFGKLAKTILRALRVGSKAELKTRVDQYINDLNAEPVVFRWKYRLDAITDA